MDRNNLYNNINRTFASKQYEEQEYVDRVVLL